jgi:DcuC family C4-dicarboxylate transporter
LRRTHCDQHLVQLLVTPLRRVRPLLIPGTVLVGFFVNLPVVSQTSTAVAIGPVLVPLLLAARISPLTTGAALLLGSSLGGELLNPGAPEVVTISTVMDKLGVHIEPHEIIGYILPLLLVQLAVAGSLFWLTSRWHESRYRPEKTLTDVDLEAPDFQVNYLKAAIPLVPLVILFLTGPPFQLLKLPHGWLVNSAEDAAGYFSSRLVGVAMVLGVAAAVAVTPAQVGTATAAFFEGAGHAFSYIIALIVAATCFSKGVEVIGLAGVLGTLIERVPGALLPTAGALPMSFAFLNGSGMATSQSLFPFFAPPTLAVGMAPAHVGAVISIAAAAGRTMSPVAAVVLMCGEMTKTSPFDLVKRVALPLVVGVSVMVTAAILMAAQRG